MSFRPERDEELALRPVEWRNLLFVRPLKDVGRHALSEGDHSGLAVSNCLGLLINFMEMRHAAERAAMGSSDDRSRDVIGESTADFVSVPHVGLFPCQSNPDQPVSLGFEKEFVLQRVRSRSVNIGINSERVPETRRSLGDSVVAPNTCF
jgi:hypothetical protein